MVFELFMISDFRSESGNQTRDPRDGATNGHLGQPIGAISSGYIQPSNLKSIPKWKFQNIHVHLYLEILLSFGKVFDLDISASPLENAKKYYNE